MNSKRVFVVLAVLLSMACLASLVSCGHTRQAKISAKMYALGAAAVEIADDYLSGKISVDDAITRLERNYDKQYDHLKDEEKEYDVSSLYDTPVSQDTRVWINTSNVLHAMRDKKSGVGVDAAIRSERDDLASVLWK